MKLTDLRLLARPLIALGLATALTGAQAATIDVAGVKLEDRITLAGSPLLLNGAGVRYKAVFQVYTAGLYLERKATTPSRTTSVRACSPKPLARSRVRAGRPMKL